MRYCVRTQALFLALLPMALLLRCTPAAEDPSSDDDNGLLTGMEPTIEISGVPFESSAGPGVWRIDFLVFGSEGTTFDIASTYTVDGVTFKTSTLADQSDALTGIPGSSEGTPISIYWDTITDVGYKVTSAWFRLTGVADGNDPLPLTIKMEEIDNTAQDADCLVELYTPSQRDGNIAIHYRVWDVKGDLCDITFRYTISDNKKYEAYAYPADDATSDPLTDVEAPPDGVQRVFVWDSLSATNAADVEVEFTATISDNNNVNQSSLSLSIQNSSTPDSGDIIFSELLPWPETSQVYVELFNASQHPLNAGGLFLTSSGDTSEDFANRVINDGAALYIDPGEYFVLNQGTSSAYSDSVLEFYPTRVGDTLTLWRGNSSNPVVVDSVTYSRDDFGGYDVYGHAISLASDHLTGDDNDNAINWCAETTLLVDSELDYGTPGDPAGCIPDPPPGDDTQDEAREGLARHITP